MQGPICGSFSAFVRFRLVLVSLSSTLRDPLLSTLSGPVFSPKDLNNKDRKATKGFRDRKATKLDKKTVSTSSASMVDGFQQQTGKSGSGLVDGGWGDVCPT